MGVTCGVPKFRRTSLNHRWRICRKPANINGFHIWWAPTCPTSSHFPFFSEIPQNIPNLPKLTGWGIINHRDLKMGPRPFSRGRTIFLNIVVTQFFEANPCNEILRVFGSDVNIIHIIPIIYIYCLLLLPVVPHKAVAKVSKIGNL